MTHILIVDDSQQMRMLMRLMLEKAGYILHVASNAKEALALLDQRTPDLIITDLMMPEIDGFQFCRMVRQRPETISTPILLRSYRVMDELAVKEAYAAGANDVMHLLVQQTEFLKRVRALLDGDSGSVKPLRR
jgi:CheY-like chemotaxis protein